MESRAAKLNTGRELKAKHNLVSEGAMTRRNTFPFCSLHAGIICHLISLQNDRH